MHNVHASSDLDAIRPAIHRRFSFKCPGGKCPGGKCPGGICPGSKCPVGYMSGGKCLGGICPVGGGGGGALCLIYDILSLSLLLVLGGGVHDLNAI